MGVLEYKSDLVPEEQTEISLNAHAFVVYFF